MAIGEHATAGASLNSRKAQMLALIDLRPYWTRLGPCTDGERVVSNAGDVPCPCADADFSCRLHSLTLREFSRLPK